MQCFSSVLTNPKRRIACNYYCKVCKQTDKLPNILGKFVIMEDGRMSCTGCKNEFTKEESSKYFANDFSI